jgi:hypothetical protein
MFIYSHYITLSKQKFVNSAGSFEIKIHGCRPSFITNGTCRALAEQDMNGIPGDVVYCQDSYIIFLLMN